MLALNDLLRLLGHTVKLHVLGSLPEVNDLQLEAFVLAVNLLELSLVIKNTLHSADLLVTARLNLHVFGQDCVFLNQDCVLVVSRYGELRYLDLSLTHVHDNLEVKFQLHFAVPHFVKFSRHIASLVLQTDL